MPFYLLQENGDKILLEDLTGFVILEAVTVPGPTVFYQGGGSGHPVGRRKRRHETQALFEAIEQGIREALGLVPPDLADAPEAAQDDAQTGPAWTAEHLETALARLAELAAGHRALEARLERLRESLDREARDRQDDDEFWMLLS